VAAQTSPALLAAQSSTPDRFCPSLAEFEPIFAVSGRASRQSEGPRATPGFDEEPDRDRLSECFRLEGNIRAIFVDRIKSTYCGHATEMTKSGRKAAMAAKLWLTDPEKILQCEVL
jgi:hypothetical protein